MSLLDELLKKAEKRPDKADIPPQLERIVAKRNKKRIYLISGLVIFTIFSGIIVLALIGRFTGFIQVKGEKIVRVSEIGGQKSDIQPQAGPTQKSSAFEVLPREGPDGQNLNKRGENAEAGSPKNRQIAVLENPVYSPAKSGAEGNPETMGPEIADKKDAQKRVRQADTEKQKKGLKTRKSETQMKKTYTAPLIPELRVPDSIEIPKVSGTEIPKQEPNQAVTENGKAVEKRGLLYRANTFELNGNYEEAIEYYERALKIDPSDYRVMNQIAYLYIKLGIPDRAIEYIERLKKFRSDYVPSMINLSVALMMKAEHAEAERVLLDVIRVEPFNKTALFNLAILYENKGRLEEAEGYYRRLLSTGDSRGRVGLKRIKSKKPLIDKNYDKDNQDGK